ncbi:sensor histidine kinase [Pseudonocardia sp. CA-107938]|uniref:sensor histidine kinase n=1 Tax=Pseudonocardia sp. CA-107938 TaxID=3240021 RepID=UPI003D9256B3
MRFAPRTLTARLVAVVVLLLAVAATVIAVSTTLILRHRLIDRLDADLRGANGFAVRIVIGPQQGTPLPQLPVPPRDPDTLTAVVNDGKVVGAAVYPRDADPVPVPEADFPQLLALTPGAPPTSATIGDFGDYRLVASRMTTGVVLVTGLTQRRVDDTVAQLIIISVIVAGVTLAGAGAAGLVLVRRELRPLQRVAATAAKVSEIPLDRGEVSLAERVPVADPATEVGTVGAALNTMLDHVGAALEARQESETRLRQFVADASHELRTPLAAIRGYAELTRRADLTPEAAYSVGRISSQSERMTALVEDLLLLARLDAGRPLERAPVDLTRLVLDTVNDAHAAGTDHRWRLDLPEEPVVVTGDASRLTQVLVNLLANARTHTPAGTAITVALEPNGSTVCLSVLDEGPGIAPELQPHVFERFARGSESRSRENGSTGLGLSIVDAVVAAHGGKVELTSRPGRTEFRVDLPTSSKG